MKKTSDGKFPAALVNLERVLMDHDRALAGMMDKLRESGEKSDAPKMVRYDEELPESSPRIMREFRGRPEFWRSLGLRADGHWILAVLVRLGYAVTIFSDKLRREPHLWGAKMRWCCENLFSGMKDCRFVAGESECDLDADVIVDDRSERVLTWLTRHPRSAAIVPSREWNKDLRHSRAIRFERERNASLTEDLLVKMMRHTPIDTREMCVRCSLKHQMPGEQVCLPCKFQLRGALIWWQRFVLGMTLSEISKEHSVSQERVNQALDIHDRKLAKRMKMECQSSGWGLRLIRSGALPPFNIPWGDIVPDPKLVKLPPEEKTCAPTKDRKLPGDAPSYVSAQEAAGLLGVNVKTIYVAIKDGTMPFIRLGRTIRIPIATFQVGQTK